jgi:hypothetical protein
MLARRRGIGLVPSPTGRAGAAGEAWKGGDPEEMKEMQVMSVGSLSGGGSKVLPELHRGAEVGGAS